MGATRQHPRMKPKQAARPTDDTMCGGLNVQYQTLARASSNHDVCDVARARRFTPAFVAGARTSGHDGSFDAEQHSGPTALLTIDGDVVVLTGVDVPLRSNSSDGPDMRPVFERIYGEEHHSQGNYFWLFSGSNTRAAVGANRSCGAASPRS